MNTQTTAQKNGSTIPAVRFCPSLVVSGDFHREDSYDDEKSDPFSASNPVLLCVIDHDNSLLREVSRVLASAYPIESFTSVQAFLKRDAHNGPCCIVLDGNVLTLFGNGFQRIFATSQRSEQIVFVSTSRDIAACARAFRAGAVDFLTKPLKNTELLRAVSRALRRSDQLFRIRQMRSAAKVLLDRLTPREREVLGFVIAGHLNKVIGAELGITEKMVKRHRGHFMRKLGVDSVAELVWLCLRSELKPTFFDGDLGPLYR